MNIRLEAGANLISADNFEFQIRIHSCDRIVQWLLLQALVLTLHQSSFNIVSLAVRWAFRPSDYYATIMVNPTHWGLYWAQSRG
jgi:hypothetical protein